jgi:hypothetical protein
MRRGLAWLAGAVGVAGAASYRAFRRRAAVAEPAEDPRAAELRQKLDESRELVQEREEFEAAETTVDEADPAEVEARRRAVHERGQAAAEQMRGRSDGE